MNVISLVSLLVVFSGISFSSAAEMELKAAERNGGGGRLQRRDLQSFQKQIQALLPFDISNKTLCPTPPCIDNLTKDATYLCNGFFSSSFGRINKIMGNLTKCYAQGFCGHNFASQTVSNVNVPLGAPANYKGQCVLYGPQVNFNFLLVSYDTKNFDAYTASYVVYETFNYTFTGLSVRCEPCPTLPPPPPPATACPNSGSNCCSFNLVTQLLCLVQKLLYALSLRIPLVPCDCTCYNHGKREAPERELSERQAAAESPAFTGSAGVRLSVNYQDILNFRKGLAPILVEANVRAATTVTLGPEVPSAYQAELVSEIQSVFNDFSIFYFLLYYYNAIINDLIMSFYNTCPGHY